jgi:hypothetical protein
VPERWWTAFCRGLEAATARLRFFDPAPVARIAKRVLGPADPAFDARAFALTSAAGRSEHHLQILRAAGPGGWNAPVELVGREHLDAALAAGHGAVLWVAHFCFNALAAKKALADAGYRAWHLSRPEHGFSKSRLGIATVNRIRVRAELEHLAGRIVIERDKPMSATLAAQRELKRNGIVSITAGAWEGQRLAGIELLGGNARACSRRAGARATRRCAAAARVRRARRTGLAARDGRCANPGRARTRRRCRATGGRAALRRAPRAVDTPLPGAVAGLEEPPPRPPGAAPALRANGSTSASGPGGRTAAAAPVTSMAPPAPRRVERSARRQSVARRRNALATTETDDRLIASAAISGDSRIPNAG